MTKHIEQTRNPEIAGYMGPFLIRKFQAFLFVR